MIIGSSLAALSARKVAPLVRPARASRAASPCSRSASSEAAADWTFVGSTFWASSLGFMIWVLVTATYLGAQLLDAYRTRHLHAPPPARNEPVRDYAPGSPERASLQRAARARWRASGSRCRS